MDRLNEIVEKMRTDPSKAKKVTKIEGEWILDELRWPRARSFRDMGFSESCIITHRRRF